VFWATVIGAVIGAAGAIAGGFAAAWWQTSQADDVAEKIRQAERRDQGLLTLNVRATVVLDQLESVWQSAQAGVTTSQWQSAATPLRELRQLWESSSSAMIPDPSIRKTFTALDVAARECLPEGSLGAERQRELSIDDNDAVVRFRRDLGHVVGLMGDFRTAVNHEAEGLLGRPKQRSGFSAATRLWSWLPRIEVSRRRGRRP
jgi:hypothetical protein